MRNAINLAKMSFVNWWSIKRVPIIMIIGYGAISIVNDVFLNMLFGMIVFMSIYQVMAYEESYNIDTLISYLPVKGSEYILSKYIFSILSIVSSAIIFSICYYISSTQNISSATMSMYIPILSICTLSTSLITSIYIPILFKVGFKKGRIVLMMIMMLGMFIPGIVSEEYALFFSKIAGIINSSSEVMLLTVVVSILLLAASYLVSCKLYKNKEIL